MKTDRLTVGMKIKYKELCELLGIEPKEGNSRKKQFKEIDKLIGYHKEGQIFVIDEIKKPYGNEENSSNYTNKNNKILLSEDRRILEENRTEIENIPFAKGDEIMDIILQNRSNLKEGNTYTYKQMCELLGITYYSGGTSKDAQLKTIQRCICIEKKAKGRYLVKKYYKVPLPTDLGNEDNLGANTYGNMFLLSMINYIEENNYWELLDREGYLYFSRPYLYEQMKMCNENYKSYKYNRKTLAEEYKMDIDIIHDFYDYNENLFKGNLSKASKNLYNRRLAIIDEKCMVIVDINENHRLATEKEKSLILDCEKEALQEMNFTTIQQVHATHRLREYYNRANEIIKTKIANGDKDYMSFGKDFDYCYKVIKVNTTSRLLKVGYKELLDEIAKAKEIANELVINRNDEYFNNKAIDNSKEVVKGFGEECKHNQLIVQLAYADEINRLKNLLIKK